MISGLTGLVIVYAILSWVQADSPIVDVIERLCAPLLRPWRKLIPLVGGIDLSPLAFLVVLQVAAIMLAYLQGARAALSPASRSGRLGRKVAKAGSATSHRKEAPDGCPGFATSDRVIVEDRASAF